MANTITFRKNDDNFDLNYAYKWDDSDTKFIAQTVTDIDTLADLEAGDALVFQQSNGRGAKYWKIDIDIAVASVYDTLEGVWEYRSIDAGGSKYGRAFKSLQNVVDSTNGFTETGVNSITFDVPTDWDNYMVMSGTAYYTWSVRFRVTSISNVTENGNIQAIKTYADRYYVEDYDDFTMTKLHQFDVDNSIGKISKLGSSIFAIDTGLLLDSDCVFNSKAESINFIHNNMPFFNGECHYGDLSSTGKPINGTTIRMEGAFVDYNNTLIGKDNSTFYSLNVSFPQEPRGNGFQGFWGAGLGSSPNQVIKGGSFADFRSFSFSYPTNILSGLTYVGTFAEPTGATMFDMVCQGSPYGIRPNSNDISAIHRFDLTDLSTACTNPWRVSSRDGWRYKLIDCKINMDLADYRVYSSDTFYADCEVHQINSLQGVVVDESSAPFNNVNIAVLDKNMASVNKLVTNEDGYIGEQACVIGTVTDTHTLRTDDMDFTNDTHVDFGDSRFRELLITNGDAKGYRSVIHKVKASGTVTMASDSSTDFAEGDRFVEIPYIIYRSQQVKQDGTSGAEDIVDLGSFTMRYRYYGYLFADDNTSFDSPTYLLKKMIKNNTIALSKEDALNVDGVVLQDSDDDDYTYELDCNDHSLDDVYHYIQATLSDTGTIHNIDTFECNEFLQRDGNKFKTIQVQKGNGLKLINYGSGKASSFTKNDGSIYVVPTVYQLTVTGILSGSIVEIYDNEVVDNGNNNTLLASTNNSGTSFSYTHDGTTNDIRVQVIKDGYVERIEDFTLNTTDQSLAMIQKTDTN